MLHLGYTAVPVVLGSAAVVAGPVVVAAGTTGRAVGIAAAGSLPDCPAADCLDYPDCTEAVRVAVAA